MNLLYFQFWWTPYLYLGLPPNLRTINLVLIEMELSPSPWNWRIDRELTYLAPWNWFWIVWDLWLKSNCLVFGTFPRNWWNWWSLLMINQFNQFGIESFKSLSSRESPICSYMTISRAFSGTKGPLWLKLNFSLQFIQRENLKNIQI